MESTRRHQIVRPSSVVPRRSTKLTTAIALAVSSLFVTIQPAQAGAVHCDQIAFSGSNGGHAWADNCRHTGASESVRLAADCKWSPFTTYSPTRSGTFSGANFGTTGCTFGVRSAGFEHL